MPKHSSQIIAPDMGAAKAKIEAAFRKLKPNRLTDQNTYLPLDVHEMMIEHFSEDLALLVFREQADPPLNVTRGQLRSLERTSLAFWISMASLQGPAIEALNFTDPTLGEFQRAVERLMEAIARAKAIKSGSDRKGPKPRVQAREIAEKAADYYARITGKRPARITYRGSDGAKAVKDRKALTGGEFFYFLATIFKALNVIASADRYGKSAIRVWTDNHPPRLK